MLEKPAITECPRDALQGLHDFIQTQDKADYINSLLKVGYDVIDFGSFVSPRIIPQLSDTAEVLKKMNLSSSRTALMALVANLKGAETAASIDEITYLSFPFSVSPTFLKLNINADFDKALITIDKIISLCINRTKKLKVYLTMAFGNPYGDESNPDIIMHWAEVLKNMGVAFISLSDITGVSEKNNISILYSRLLKDIPSVEFGFHLHTTPDTWYDKVDAAWQSGCRSFDAVINGMGGCPMTGYDLVGNLNTLDLLQYFKKQSINTGIDQKEFENAVMKSRVLFGI